MKTQLLLSQAYAAFNKQDADAVLSMMADTVSWPKASEGGRVKGKQQIREYWIRQWADFDPKLDILEIIDREHGKTDVKVHQLVKDRRGEVLSDTELWHQYTIRNGQIERMDILEGDSNTQGVSAAFRVRGHSPEGN